MKRFKNVIVGDTNDFENLTVDGESDTTLPTIVKLQAGFIFVNQDSGAVWMLSKYGTSSFWVRTDNAISSGYNEA